MRGRGRPDHGNDGCRLGGFGDGAEPVDRRLIGLHGAQSCVAPEMTGKVFEFEDVDRVPALSQAMCAGGDPEGGRKVFHGAMLLYIRTVFSSR